MSTVPDRPPVRTGKCSLTLVIDGKRYRLSVAPPIAKGAKIWHVRVLPGQERSGRTYSICSYRKMIDCTCPDATQNGAVCKHVRALQVLGLVAKSARPSALARWEASQEANRQKPDRLARARRRHVPDVAPTPESAPAFPLMLPPVETDPAMSFSAGWKDAVRAQLAVIAAGKS